MAFLLFILFICVGLPFIFFRFASYGVHLSMTRENALQEKKKIRRGNFKEFLKVFNSIEGWARSSSFNDSLFTQDEEGNFLGNGSIHASMVKFNGVYFEFNTTLEWLEFCLWIKKYTKGTVKKATYLKDRW